MYPPTCARVSSCTRSRQGSRLTTERISVMDGRCWRKFALHRANNICFRLSFDDKIRLLFTGIHFWVAPVVASFIDDIKNEHPDTKLSWKAMAGTPPETHPLELPMSIRLWRAGLGSKPYLQAQQLMMHVHTLQIIVLYPFMALEISGLSISSLTSAEVAPWKAA